MGWLGALRTLLVISAAAHLAWEVVQLPLYTIWWTSTAGEIAFAVLHCTAGDLGIMTSSLVGALVVFGQGWPSSETSFRKVMFATIVVGVAMAKMDMNIFVQVGFVVLVGLAAKNAILIVEFARQAEQNGLDRRQAAIQAASVRLRPILMTSFAFIMGVVPLVFSSGAGAEMRHAIGIVVFSGMLGVTFFGLFLTPVFYVILRLIGGGKFVSHHAHEPLCKDADQRGAV